MNCPWKINGKGLTLNGKLLDSKKDFEVLFVFILERFFISGIYGNKVI